MTFTSRAFSTFGILFATVKNGDPANRSPTARPSYATIVLPESPPALKDPRSPLMIIWSVKTYAPVE